MAPVKKKKMVSMRKSRWFQWKRRRWFQWEKVDGSSEKDKNYLCQRKNGSREKKGNGSSEKKEMVPVWKMLMTPGKENKDIVPVNKECGSCERKKSQTEIVEIFTVGAVSMARAENLARRQNWNSLGHRSDRDVWFFSWLRGYLKLVAPKILLKNTEKWSPGVQMN